MLENFNWLLITRPFCNILTDGEWEKVKQTCTIEAYQDFLIKYPKTRHIKELTDSLRIFWKRYNENIVHSHRHGNNIRLLINSEGMLLLRYKPILIGQVKDEIKEIILNPDRLDYLPEFKTIRINGLGTFEVSKAVIEIGTDKGLNSKTYSIIIEKVKEAFIEIREDFSKKLWGKSIENLNKLEQEQIKQIVPIRIRFESYDTNPPLPKPPPKHLFDEIFSQDSIDSEIEIDLEVEE